MLQNGAVTVVMTGGNFGEYFPQNSALRANQRINMRAFGNGFPGSGELPQSATVDRTKKTI